MTYSPLGYLRHLVRDMAGIGKQRWTDLQLQEFLDEAYREFYWRTGQTVTASSDGFVGGTSEAGVAFPANAGTVVAIEAIEWKNGSLNYVPIAMDSWAGVRWMQQTEGIFGALIPNPTSVATRLGANSYNASGPQSSDVTIAFYPIGNYTFRLRAVMMTTSPDMDQIGLSQAVPYAAAMIAAACGWDRADVAYLLREAPEWAQIAQQTNRWSTRPNTYQLEDALAGVT